MKKWINFISEWFQKLWRMVLYIGGVVALILEVAGVLHGWASLAIFFDCMIFILMPRICDEVFKPLFKENDKEI
jgi:hypothetical protein